MSSFLVALTLALLTPARQDPPAPTIDQVFRSGEESVWVFEAAGKRIGEHASRYAGRVALPGVDAHRFEGRARLVVDALSGLEMKTTADLWTDDAGHPVRFVQHALVGEAYSRVELAFGEKSVHALVVQGSSTRELDLPFEAPVWLLANNFIGHLELALALLPPGKDAQARLFSGNTLQALPYRLTFRESFEHEVGGAKLTGHVYEDSLGERIRVVGGRILDLEVRAQELVIRRSDERLDPFTISPPRVRKKASAFDAEEVLIEHDGARIAGTLTRRKGAKGRSPAIFFVSGSGPQDRDGLSSGIDLGTHEILDRLTADGFCVLRVDDRGAGSSSPLPEDTSFQDLVADARACIAWLAKRDDVDPARIAILGHSEGALTAPILAAEQPAIAAIVLMASPGRPIHAILVDQNRLALEREGVGGAQLEARMKEIEAFLAKLGSDEAIDEGTLPPELRASLASRTWFKSHATLDPLVNVCKVRCPILILQGGKDFQVSAERDARALAAALEACGHEDHELRVLDGLDHLFKKSPGEQSQLADYWKDRRVDAGFLDVLSAWLGARLRAEGR